MKKFGTNKRNPNPPWPNEQAVVMIPPGSNPSAVGMGDQRLYNMSGGTSMNPEQKTQQSNTEEDRSFSGENHRIMGEMPIPTDRIMPDRARNSFSVQNNNTNMPVSGNNCGGAYISGYLCGQTGKYVRLEFLFGEQTHVEKTGILREVGRNYIVMQEMGTNNMVVSPLDKIKFINIYSVNGDNDFMT